MAIVGAVALPFAAVSPAGADQVRQKLQWVLNALNVSAAWHVTHGRGVTVAVIDSGVDPNVSDLTGRVIPGPDYSGVKTPTSNLNWGAHGTWMASLIVGHGHGKGSGSGVLGIAPAAKVLSIRVITDRSDPGYSSYQAKPRSWGQAQLAKAIKYAVDHHAQVVSMSLGYVAPSLGVRAALQYAMNHNVVVIASAGNSGTAQTATGHRHAPYSFPADYPGVIAVAAVGRSGLPAYFSSENLSVQVAAPGVNIPVQGRGSRYWLVSGTSPACALTAGVVALVRAKYPKLTAAQVRRAITSSASTQPRGGYNDEVGFGEVDAAQALVVAGRLSRLGPVGGAVARKAASGYFGGGPAAVPAVPISPRSKRFAFLFYALAAASLLILMLSCWRLVVATSSRRSPRALGPEAAAASPNGPPPSERPIGGPWPAAASAASPGGASGDMTFGKVSPDMPPPWQQGPAEPWWSGQPASRQHQPGGAPPTTPAPTANAADITRPASTPWFEPVPRQGDGSPVPRQGDGSPLPGQGDGSAASQPAGSTEEPPSHDSTEDPASDGSASSSNDPQ